ncbi:MAG: HAD-IIIA family hydrolase [Acidimicrobiales bacterium]
MINRRIVGGYVTRWSGFAFLPGALEGLALLARHAALVVVVTNQAGIGKGLMSEADFADITGRMVAAVDGAGGRIDGVFHCPHRADACCTCRKPAIGLAEQAAAAFAGLDLSRAVLIGDADSDIAMANALGIASVLVTPEPRSVRAAASAYAADLLAAATLLSASAETAG